MKLIYKIIGYINLLKTFSYSMKQTIGSNKISKNFLIPKNEGPK